jgi:hypothetical protein
VKFVIIAPRQVQLAHKATGVARAAVQDTPSSPI